jgi:hypothetical protein
MFITNAAVFLVLLALTKSFCSAQSGGFLASCKECNIEIGTGPTVFLACLCGDGKGGYPSTEIKLGSCFGNSNGHIVFQHKYVFTMAHVVEVGLQEQSGGFDGSCINVQGFRASGSDYRFQANCSPGRIANTVNLSKPTNSILSWSYP